MMSRVEVVGRRLGLPAFLANRPKGLRGLPFINVDLWYTVGIQHEGMQHSEAASSLEAFVQNQIFKLDDEAFKVFIL